MKRREVFTCTLTRAELRGLQAMKAYASKLYRAVQPRETKTDTQLSTYLEAADRFVDRATDAMKTGDWE